MPCGRHAGIPRTGRFMPAIPDAPGQSGRIIVARLKLCDLDQSYLCIVCSIMDDDLCSPLQMTGKRLGFRFLKLDVLETE